MPLSPLSSFLPRLHRDQRGAISLLSVFGIFLFTILLGQLMNIGRQIDDKLRMQNAADAAAYSGGVAVARGMNALAFSNHILCETFALTAYMREARDRHSDPFIPPVLAAWNAVGERFSRGTSTDKFHGLGEAIVAKTKPEPEPDRIEQAIVDQFSEMAFRQSRVTLPAFEYLLMGPEQMPGHRDGGFIPRFQRAVVLTTPALALAAADDIARRYGQSSQSLHRGEPLRALLWRTNGEVVGMSSEFDPMTRVIPAIDPSPTGPDANVPLAEVYYCLSKSERDRLAHLYLRSWITNWQGQYFEWDGSVPPRGFETAKMSNYINFFRIFACGQLHRLLNEEYPNTNLPHVHRELWRALDGDLPENPCRYLHPRADRDVLTFVNPIQSMRWSSRSRRWVPFDPTSDLVYGREDYRTVEEENVTLEREYNFIATTFWPQMTTLMPGLYQNPLHRGQRTYAVTFAQAEVYVPRWRHTCCEWIRLRHCEQFQNDAWSSQTCLEFGEPWNPDWDIFNQNWTARLVPATASTLPQILETHPQNFVPGVLSNYQAPQLGTSLEDFRLVNGH